MIDTSPVKSTTPDQVISERTSPDVITGVVVEEVKEAATVYALAALKSPVLEYP